MKSAMKSLKNNLMACSLEELHNKKLQMTKTADLIEEETLELESDLQLLNAENYLLKQRADKLLKLLFALENTQKKTSFLSKFTNAIASKISNSTKPEEAKSKSIAYDIISEINNNPALNPPKVENRTEKPKIFSAKPSFKELTSPLTNCEAIEGLEPVKRANLDELAEIEINETESTWPSLPDIPSYKN